MTDTNWRRVLGPKDFKGWVIHLEGKKGEMIAAHPLIKCIVFWILFQLRYPKWWKDNSLVGEVYSLRVYYYNKNTFPTN